MQSIASVMLKTIAVFSPLLRGGVGAASAVSGTGGARSAKAPVSVLFTPGNRTTSPLRRGIFLWFALLILPAVAFAHDVTLQEAEKAVGAAIVADGLAEIADATITSTRLPVLYRAPRPVTLEIRTLKAGEDSKAWSAHLYVMDGEDVITALPLSGRFEELTMVPVLRQRVHRGDTIEQSDIDYQPQPVARLRKDTVLNPKEMIGLTPARIISAGRPVRNSELQQPAVLEKGANVTMQFDSPFMTIRTVGEAMEAGALGELIRVKNHDSGVTVQARITSPDTVTVGGRESIKRIE